MTRPDIIRGPLLILPFRGGTSLLNVAEDLGVKIKDFASVRRHVMVHLRYRLCA